MIELNCPVCGAPLSYDLYETEWEHDKYYDYFSGECPQCGRTFTWTQVYSFDHTQDFKLIEEGE